MRLRVKRTKSDATGVKYPMPLELFEVKGWGAKRKETTHMLIRLIVLNVHPSCM